MTGYQEKCFYIFLQNKIIIGARTIENIESILLTRGSKKTRAIQMTGTLDGEVILILPNSQNFILSSFSYRSCERFFV
jgi:hypothetical protein